MGHRAEKAQYGSMDAFKRATVLLGAGVEKPRSRPAKIGKLLASGNREWKPRHLGVK